MRVALCASRARAIAVDCRRGETTAVATPSPRFVCLSGWLLRTDAGWRRRRWRAERGAKPRMEGVVEDRDERARGRHCARIENVGSGRGKK